MENNNKKILIFQPYYPPHIGGVENYTEELCKHLAKNNINITIFTPHIPSSAPKMELQEGSIEIIRFPAFEIISNYPLPKFWKIEFWKLFLNLFKRDFDAIFSQTRFFFTSFLALIYAKIKRNKWIHIEHGSDYINVSSTLTNIIAKNYDIIIGSIIFKFSNINVCISEAVNAFVKKFDNRNSPVIYRGLNLESIDTILPNTLLKEKYKEKIIIAFTGRLYKWKGVENSIIAIKNLPINIKKDVIFIIAGDGEDFNRLQKIKDDSVIMLGNVTREEVFAIQKIANIYIHSALPGGGLATSLLEAMYCKCAIIATPNEGAKEVIKNEKTGLLIEKSDPILIQKSIEKYIKNKNFMELYGNNAHKLIKDEFTWKRSVDQLIAIIEK